MGCDSPVVFASDLAEEMTKGHTVFRRGPLDAILADHIRSSATNREGCRQMLLDRGAILALFAREEMQLNS